MLDDPTMDHYYTIRLTPYIFNRKAYRKPHRVGVFTSKDEAQIHLPKEEMTYNDRGIPKWIYSIEEITETELSSCTLHNLNSVPTGFPW